MLKSYPQKNIQSPYMRVGCFLTNGAASQIRTGDLLFTKQLLYQLS